MRMTKLFVKRALRSHTVWVIIITIVFCLANYMIFQKVEIIYSEYQQKMQITPKPENYGSEGINYQSFIGLGPFDEYRNSPNNFKTNTNFKRERTSFDQYGKTIKKNYDLNDNDDTETTRIDFNFGNTLLTPIEPTRPIEDKNNLQVNLENLPETKTVVTFPTEEIKTPTTPIENNWNTITFENEDKLDHIPASQIETITPINTETQNSLPGEMGQPFYVPKDLIEEANERFAEFQFNIVASDMIALNRSLPDLRSEACKKKKYLEDLPKTSIIIVFRNEAWSTLLRTVWSVINRTPHRLLAEIILVDDASEYDFLGKQLEDYVENLPVPVKVLRMKERLGLIKGRLYGVENSTGSVVLFLDSHCECTDGWIEPLLSRIATNRNVVVSPQIDIIDDTTFKIWKVYEQVGGFDWILDFQWMEVPERELKRINYDKTEPIQTPTIAGGLIAIDKQFFYEIGAYDDEMDIWGAENLEMSFRVWQCGGILELIQCSRVGHVFRRTTPHKFPRGERQTIFTNKARVAEVWMDKWKEIFFALNPDAISGNVTKRKELRTRLNCKNFEWYLKNVYPENILPLEYNHLGRIRNIETQDCLDSTGRDLQNNVEFTKYKICLSQSNRNETQVNFRICDNNIEGQNWFYDYDSKIFIHLKSGKCLTQSINGTTESIATLNDCDENSSRQKWELAELLL
ncbi:polypeptide N-acetylgalactosaminyltransferase 5-like [Condylostylus longicornis]|uniref:polypeptide N-acetylgalactosaminyltransferase 5-like n=1 Tax=Condylostylus longicornis TaxID=2530218 RepID=UPI00244DD755|nr:polypeptide N-acetylgalactosaminyltransferase 5-like [Condylostylus longicornis]